MWPKKKRKTLGGSRGDEKWGNSSFDGGRGSQKKGGDGEKHAGLRGFLGHRIGRSASGGKKFQLPLSG